VTPRLRLACGQRGPGLPGTHLPGFQRSLTRGAGYQPAAIRGEVAETLPCRRSPRYGLAVRGVPDLGGYVPARRRPRDRPPAVRAQATVRDPFEDQLVARPLEVEKDDPTVGVIVGGQPSPAPVEGDVCDRPVARHVQGLGRADLEGLDPVRRVR